MNNIFNKKKEEKLENPFGENNRTWWEGVKKFVSQHNPKIVVDKSDPEYDAQKIYQHWINFYR